MATNKPTKPSNEFLSTGFGGIKHDFDATRKNTGFSATEKQILQGDNLNYTLDTIGKQLKYLTTVVDYLTDIGVGYVPYINSNNQLDIANINTLLPSQSGNNGKLLTTNGTNVSWSGSIKEIGDLYFTSNFNKVLASNEVWLDGTAGTNNDGVVPTTGDWASLFAIYGWVYDTSYTNTGYFKLPDFTNKCIWGGTSAGYILSGLPILLGLTNNTGNHTHTTSSVGGHTHVAEESGEHTHTVGGADNNTSSPRNGFDLQGNSKMYRTVNINTTSAGQHTHTLSTVPNHQHITDSQGGHQHSVTITSNVSNLFRDGVNIVQPPAIKVRVYTRYK